MTESGGGPHHNAFDPEAPELDATASYRLTRPLVLVVSAKALLFAVAALSTVVLPDYFSFESFEGNFRWPPDQPVSWITMFKTWDAQHYLFLCEHGYQPGHMSNAMYPLWPMLIRVAAFVTGDALLAALILSNVFSVTGLVLLHRFTHERHGPRVADVALLLTLAFPGALFYCFAYSESLFLLITVGCFFAIHRRSWYLAALLGALAPASRAVGIFIVVPLGFALLSAWRRREVGASHLALAFVPLLGTAFVLQIMYVATGDPFAGFKAQSAYVAEGTVLKVLDVPAFVMSFFTVDTAHTILHSPFDRVWLMLALVGLWLMARREKLYCFHSLPLVVVPAMSMSFMAYTRYVAAAFPLFIVFGMWLGAPRWRTLRWIILAVLAGIQVYFLVRHINARWAA